MNTSRSTSSMTGTIRDRRRPISNGSPRLPSRAARSSAAASRSGAAAFVVGAGGIAARPARAVTTRMRFDAVAANIRDTVTVPPGYGWHVVARWGDPMWSDSIPFDQATRGSGAQPGARLRRQQRRHGAVRRRRPERPRRQQRVRQPQGHLRRHRHRRAGERRRRAQGQGRPRHLDRRNRADRRPLVDRLSTRPATAGSPPIPRCGSPGPRLATTS